MEMETDRTYEAAKNKRGNPFTNMKVSRKIGAGLGITLVFLVAVAGVGYFGLSGANSSFKEYRSYARQTNQMGRVQANLLLARLYAKDYILKNTEESAEKVRQRISTTVTLIDEAKALFSEPDAIQAMDLASGQIHSYQENFEVVTEFVKQRNALVERMNELGPQSERALTEIMKSAFDDGDASASYRAGITLRHLLLARLYSNRFLVDNLPASDKRANQELSAFQKTSEDMRSELQNPTRRRLASKVVELAGQYHDTFKKTAGVIYDRNKIITGTLDVIGPALADEMENLKLENKGRQDELGPLATQRMDTAVLATELVSALAILLGIALAFFVGRAIARPIVNMTTAMRKLADGDLEAEIPATQQSDEIGEMASAVQIFKDNAIEVERLKAEKEELDRKAAEEKQAQMAQLADNFDSTVGSIIGTVSSAATELQHTAQSMTTTAEEANTQSAAVASASDNASTNVQTVASSAEELTASIAEISRQIKESNSFAQKAVEDANTANNDVKSLDQAARTIGDVVNLISDIAEQTNLLALNATIEAARAGEAGKGFAVVASEVKSLANQTAKATDEISSQVEAMQSATSSTVESIQKITDVIKQISDNAAAISAAAEEQSSATVEISRSVQEASSGTQEVATNITDVRRAAEETGVSSGQVLSAATELSQQAEKLRGEVDRFISGLRAA